MKHFLYYWLPVLVYAGLIFYLSSLPTIPPLVIEIMPETLIWHVIEYAILGILLFRAFINSRNDILKNNAIFLAIMIASFYGITDEIHQLFVPGRIFSYLDMMVDFVGSNAILTKDIFIKGKIYFKRQSKIHF